MTVAERFEAAFPYSTLPKIVVERCPVCEAPRLSKGTIGHDRFGFIVTRVRCQKCSLLYLGEQLTREGYDLLYAGAYRRLVWALATKGRYDPTGAAEPPPSRCQFTAQYTAYLTNWLSTKVQTILDAGGGSGAVGKAIAARLNTWPVPQVTVLDPAAAELPTDVPTIRGYLEDPIPGSFDLAICFETVDHLTNPIAALCNLRAAVPNGMLCIDVIDIQRLFRTGYGCFKIDHPLNWTRKSFLTALERTGWRPAHSAFLVQTSRRFKGTHPFRMLFGCL